MPDPVKFCDSHKTNLCEKCGVLCYGRLCRPCYVKLVLPKNSIWNQLGEKNPMWKVGKKNSGGYIKILIESVIVDGKRVRKYKAEHRLVMEKILGRLLGPAEQVHHRDGNRSNNVPENLELRSGPHGAGATRHCPTCTCGED